MRRGATASLAVLAALQCACTALFAVREPLRIENWQDLDERQLTFAQGTTLQEAEQIMRRVGLTGIRTDTYVGDGSRMLSAISADFQSRIHLFEDNRYQRSVLVRSGGVLPFGYALRVAKSRDQLLLVALYRDPVGLTNQAASAKGPRLSLFVDAGRGFEFVKTLPLDSLAAANGGMTSPIFVGHDLGEGVMFLARDRNGRLWSSAYLMSIDGAELSLKPLPLEQAARCSCVERYVYALSPDDLLPE